MLPSFGVRAPFRAFDSLSLSNGGDVVSSGLELTGSVAPFVMPFGNPFGRECKLPFLVVLKKSSVLPEDRESSMAPSVKANTLLRVFSCDLRKGPSAEGRLTVEVAGTGDAMAREGMIMHQAGIKA